jgi:hypothetical protein
MEAGCIPASWLHKKSLQTAGIFVLTDISKFLTFCSLVNGGNLDSLVSIWLCENVRRYLLCFCGSIIPLPAQNGLV